MVQYFSLLRTTSDCQVLFLLLFKENMRFIYIYIYYSTPWIASPAMSVIGCDRLKAEVSEGGSEGVSNILLVIHNFPQS